MVHRIVCIEGGLVGDIKSVGEGISELRNDYGSGYRLCFVRCGDIVVVLLCGGDKDTRDRDIRTAKVLVEGLDD